MPKRRQKPILTELAFERRAADLRLWIGSQVTPFKSDTATKRWARIERARTDREFFAQTYFPHRLTEPSPEFHRRIDEATTQRRAAIEVFRGGAKTTRAVLIGYIHDVCFQTEDYLQYFTTTDDLAETKLDQISAELETNARLRHDFGDLVGPVWRSDRIVTANDVCVDAMGLGSAIRGMTDHKGRRPTKATVDDPDEDVKVESAVQRTKLLNKILKAIIPGLEPKRGKFHVIGTAMHPECIIEMFMRDDRFGDFYRVSMPAEDLVTGELAWPERFGREVLDEIKRLIGLAAYSSEFLNQPMDPETQELTEADIQFFSDAELSRVEIIASAGALDPSLGKTESADFQALVCGGAVKTRAGQIEIWITAGELVRRPIDQLIELVFSLHQIYDFLVFGVETTAFQDVLRQWIEVQARERGIWLNVEPLPAPGGEGGKLARIRGIFPFIKAGRFRFHERLRGGELVRQLISFPKGKKDGPDALEMLSRILRRYGAGDSLALASAGRRQVAAMLSRRFGGELELGGYPS